MISKREFEELTAKLRAVEKYTTKKTKSWWSKLTMSLRWWHIVLAIVINDILLIALGASIASAFYQIEPIDNGSFRADNIEVAGLKIDPGSGDVNVLMESFDAQTELALKSAKGMPAMLSMTDAAAPDDEIFSLLSVLSKGKSARSLELNQGSIERLAIVEGGALGASSGKNDTDIRLDPSERGHVIIKGDLELGKTRISTHTGPLQLAPKLHDDLELLPTGNGTVTIQNQLILFGSTVSTATEELLLQPADKMDLVLQPSNASIRLFGPFEQDGGDVVFRTNMTISDSLEVPKLLVTDVAVFDEDVTLGNSMADTLNFNGHIKSCGTSDIEKFFCDSSKLVFDADDNGIAMNLYMPDPDAQDESITFPIETGEVLTTASKTSALTRVGALEGGSLVNGFGAAEVATLTSRGASNLFGDTTIGISRDNLVQVKGHIAEEALFFDFNSDGVRYIFKIPDPSEDREEWPCYINTGDINTCVADGVIRSASITFPVETGTILTHVSRVSQLQEVGDVHRGSLQPGFGSATVSMLTTNGPSFLAGNVRLGSTLGDTISIAARVLNERLVFDANSDGASLSIWFPDPLMSQTIYFPERSGELLTDTSTYSVLTSVGDLEQGSILEGFGPIHAFTLKSTGNAELYDDVQLGDVITDVVNIIGHVVSHELLFDANSDSSGLTLEFPDPTTNHLIAFPEETGTVLTTFSSLSNLTEVADLNSGNIVSGFGQATVTYLQATGNALLRGNNTFGSTRGDNLIINSRLYVDELVINHPLNHGFSYALTFPTELHSPVSISFPPEQYAGELLTAVSEFSSLTAVAELTAGAINAGFGTIETANAITGSELTSTGQLRGLAGAEFGSLPDDVITLRGALEVRGPGALGTMFSVAPQNGNTMIRGDVTIRGAIEALHAPFFVDTIHVSYLTELEDDEGVNIEGMIFKDGGFPFALTDEINEFTDGQGVRVEGVLFRRGAIVAEAATPGMSPVGNADLITLTNEGRDFMMMDTKTSIKFRQWHQGVPDNTSYASDSGQISVGTETDWRRDPSTRSAYMSMSTMETGTMKERVHIDADGDFHLNIDEADNSALFTSYAGTGNLYNRGNVSVGEGYEGARTVTVGSEDLTASVVVDAKSNQGSVVIQSGNGHSSLLSVIGSENAGAIIRLKDPAPEQYGSTFDFVLDGSGTRTTAAGEEGLHKMKLVNTRNVNFCENITTTYGVINPYNITREVCQWVTSDPITIFSINSDVDTGRGNLNISGHLGSLTAKIDELLEAGDLFVHNNAQIGSSIDDRLALLGHIVSENITIDLDGDDDHVNDTLTIQFLRTDVSQLIQFPGDESGKILTTASNYSTLRAVAELTVGSIGEGFGHAEVASLGAKGTIQSRGEIIFGDEPGDGVNIAGHFRETQLVFDKNSDFWRTTLQIPDPSPALPPFNRTCAMFNGTAVDVLVPWEHDDFRKFAWTNVSLTATEAVIALTNEVINLITIPLNQNLTDVLFYDGTNASCCQNRTIEMINCAYECNENGTDCDFNDVTEGIQTLREAMLLYMYTELLPTQLTGVSHTLKFPQDDGTILHRRANGETNLIGDVFLGEFDTDSIRFPGTIQGDVRIEGNVIGKKIECTNQNLNAAFGSPQECEVVMPNLFRSFPSMTCDDSWTLLGVTDSRGAPIAGRIGDYCPIECYPRCNINGTAIRFRNLDYGDTLEEIILVVPKHTASQTLILPDNTGTILSDSSSFSTLNKVGVLEDLTVNGSVFLNGATGYNGSLHIGAVLDSTRTSVYMDGVFKGDAGGDTINFGGPSYATTYISGCNAWSNGAYTGSSLAPFGFSTLSEDLIVIVDGAAQVLTLTVDIANAAVAVGIINGLISGATASVDALSGTNIMITSATADSSSSIYISAASNTHAMALFGSGVAQPAYCTDNVYETQTNFTSITFDYSNTGPRADVRPGGVQRLLLPEETGTLISSGSDFQVITGLGQVSYGALVSGFGAAHVLSLRSTTDSQFDGNTTIGDEASDQITLLGTFTNGPGVEVMRFEGTIDDDNDLVVTTTNFTTSRTISYPDEDGRLLTTTSKVSTLAEVGALDTGSIVEGFGAAHVASLTVTGQSAFNGETILGDGYDDRILFEGSIASHTIRFDRSGNAGSISLYIPDPVSEEVTISMPTYSGTIILDTTRRTGITGTAALDTGSITEGFGPITVGRSGGIQTVNGQPIVASGDLVAEGSTVFSHTGVIAGPDMRIPADKSLVRITPGNGDNNNYFTMPSGETGEILVIQNDDNIHCYPLDQGVIDSVPPDDTAVFFHIGYRWVEISRLLEYNIDGSSAGKIPIVQGPKRMKAADGLYWDDEDDHMTIKSTNSNAKFSLESEGFCDGYLPHQAECRNNATRYTLSVEGGPGGGRRLEEGEEGNHSFVITAHDVSRKRTLTNFSYLFGDTLNTTFDPATNLSTPVACEFEWDNTTNTSVPSDSCYKTEYTSSTRDVFKAGGSKGFDIQESNITMNPGRAMAVRDQTGTSDLLSIDTHEAGRESIDLHAPFMTITAGTFPEQSGEMCDPCTCDQDGVVDGVTTGKMGCFMFYLGAGMDDDAVVTGPLEDGSTGRRPSSSNEYFCMVHPDCSEANGTIDGSSYKLCGSAGDPVTECNTLGGATTETTEFGTLAVTGSSVSINRKLVKYYSDGVSSRTSRDEFNVVSFDDSGTLSLADKQIDMMAQNSFTLLAPIQEFQWASGRRRQLSAANRTVLSITDLNTGVGNAAMTVETLAISSNTSTSLNTMSLTVSRDGTDAFTIGASGIMLVTDVAQASTVKVVTTETLFRTKADDGNILSISGVVPGQETVQINAPVLNLDTRVVTASGSKFGGELLLATQKTVLQTSTATAEDVAVLTVEDVGKPCVVTLVARPNQRADLIWYTIDYDPTVYGPFPSWTDYSIINIPMNLPGGQHFVSFYSGFFGWYGGGMEAYDAYGALISVDDNGDSASGVNTPGLVRSTADGSKMNFNLGADGSCERVEANFNSEYVDILDKHGTRSFLTVDMQDPAKSGHAETLTLSAPLLKLGQVGDATTLDGETVTVGAGAAGAMRFTYTGFAGFYAGSNFVAYDFSGGAAEPLVIEIDGATAVTISFDGNCASAAACAVLLSAAITGATASESGGLLTITSDVVGASSSVVVTGGSGAPIRALFGSGAAATPGEDVEAGAEMIGLLTVSDGTVFQSDISMPTGVADVELEATTVTLNSPTGTVNLDARQTRVIGRKDIYVDAVCNGAVSSSVSYIWEVEHCEYVSNGNTVIGVVEADCTGVNYRWMLSSCTHSVSGVVVEEDLIEDDCTGPSGYSGPITTCDDMSRIFLNANEVVMQADGHQIITLTSGVVGHDRLNYGPGADPTELKIASDVTRVRNRADDADVLFIDNTDALGATTISLNPSVVTIGDRTITEAYTFYAAHCENAMTGTWGGQAQALCSPPSFTWVAQDCVDPVGSSVVVTGAEECAAYSKTVTEAVTVESEAIGLTANINVDVTAAKMNVDANFRMGGKMGLSYGEVDAANTIYLCGGSSAETCGKTMVVVRPVGGTQSNDLVLPTADDNPETGDMLVIYNLDDSPVSIRGGPDIPNQGVGQCVFYGGTTGIPTGSWACWL